MKITTENISFALIIKVVSGIGVIVAAVIGVYTFFAPVSYVEAEVEQLRKEDSYLAMRLDRKILVDRYEQKKKERREIEFNFGTTDPTKMPAPYNQMYRELVEEERELQRKIEKLDERMDNKKYGG